MLCFLLKADVSIFLDLYSLLSEMEAKMAEKRIPPSLEEIVKEVASIRQELTGTIVRSMVMQNHQEELNQHKAPCPHCGRMVCARPARERAVETLMGDVHLMRPYFYCVHCQHGFYPLDETLKLLPGKKQADIGRAGALLASEVPYETASDLFEELTGIALSNHSLHAGTDAVGEDLTVLDVCPTAEQIQQAVEQVAQKSARRPIMVLAIDGAHAPTRPETAKGKRRGRKKVRAKRAHWKGEWREVKGVRFYIVDEDQIIHLISWHQVQLEGEVVEALRAIKEAGLIPQDDIRLCALGDGAPWIWNCVEQIFPSAKQILDYYHCSEYIHKIAKAQYGHDPQKALEWTEATMVRLFCNEIHGVIWGLQRMKPHDDKAKEQIRKGINYLTNNSHRVPYGSAKKGGYPIGSGGIESSNKFICHVRLKRSGAWWYATSANHILALRCAKYNGTFDRVFANYVEKILNSRKKEQS
jgi:hypothetical protein